LSLRHRRILKKDKVMNRRGFVKALTGLAVVVGAGITNAFGSADLRDLRVLVEGIRYGGILDVTGTQFTRLEVFGKDNCILVADFYERWEGTSVLERLEEINEGEVITLKGFGNEEALKGTVVRLLKKNIVRVCRSLTGDKELQLVYPIAQVELEYIKELNRGH
jgi:hypothetical protein